MYKQYQQRIAQLVNTHQSNGLADSKIGLEKESLRVSSEGKIAQTPHPAVLGSALTHPYITTDYSEALLELITPPDNSIAGTLSFLERTQAFVQQNLDDEILWANSMPCIVTGEASIPIAQYGSSNPGIMKTVYRRGLGHRYGRMMQVIAGIHFNYSLPETFWPGFQDAEKDVQPLQDFISHSYFNMVRNLQRYGWLIPYLFGASPVVCRSFIDGVAAGLEQFDEYTFYLPYATSLRLGDIGYQNRKEDKVGIKAGYDSLDDYVTSLGHAINTACPAYEKFGIKVDGEYQQLNTSLLQIENEYYGTVRPKQIIARDEKPSLALKRRGVRYVELRSLDLNLFEPTGINADQLCFLETFLLFCLLQESPRISDAERREIDLNMTTTAHRGREPGLQLSRNNSPVSLKAWASEILDAMESCSALLDKANNNTACQAGCRKQREVVQDPENTPSARIIREMREQKESFFPYSMRYSQMHAGYFNDFRLDPQQQAFFNDAAQQSVSAQQQMEADDNISFDEFLSRYQAQT